MALLGCAEMPTRVLTERADDAGADEQAQAVAAVQRVLGGDREAFRWVVETYQARVYGLALRMLGDPNEAEDVSQETFLRAYLYLGSYRPHHRFKTWLFSIAAHLCIDRLRRRRRAPASLDEATVGESAAPEEGNLALADPAPLPEEVVNVRQREALVRAMLAELPPLDRMLVAMAYLDDLKLEEIARATHLSVSAVKSRLFRARQRMSRSKWAIYLLEES